MYKHILIPTDGSALSRGAARSGVALAAALGAKATAFFAGPAPTPLVYEGFLPTGYATQEQHAKMIERTAAKYLGYVEGLCSRAGVPCRSVHVINEFAADAIIAAAVKHRCDLIVMASHGRRGLAGVLLGSETQKVLTHSKIPVLVCR